MKHTQTTQPKARRKRPWHEPLPPSPRDPDIARVKAHARDSPPPGGPAPPAMATTTPRPGDQFFPPELLRLLRTAQQVIDQHVNRAGRCAACASRWPCRHAKLAEFTLGAI